MNELRELNVAEMSAVEGGSDPLGDFLAEIVSGLQELFSSQVLGPIIEGIQSFFSDLASSIVSFLEGLFD